MPIFTYEYLILFYISSGIFFISFSLVFLCIYPKNSFDNIKTCQNHDISYPDCILVRIQDFQATLGESWSDLGAGWTVFFM